MTIKNLRTVGLLLYRCEGTKRGNKRMIEFVNSDDEIIGTFIQFLEKEFHVPLKI
jgi:hypothetical protein